MVQDGHFSIYPLNLPKIFRTLEKPNSITEVPVCFLHSHSG